MDNDLTLRGKTALVTGSGRNIGRAIVLEFAARGANVVINTRSNADEAHAVARQAEALGVGAAVVLGDSGDKATIDRLKLEAERRFGRVDIYVSNAAKRLYKNFFETSDEDWHRHLNQQLSASWYLAKAFVPGMQQARWGRIIHINGPDGYNGGWTRIPHSTAKGALRTLTKSLARGLGEFGITVNDVAPGHIDTVRDPTTHPQMTADVAKRVAGELPIRRLPTPEDIAWACAFLCAPRSGAITGSVIHVDGGQHMFG